MTLGLYLVQNTVSQAASRRSTPQLSGRLPANGLFVGGAMVAGWLFSVVQVAVLGPAAYTYERTDSLLALAYLSLLLTGPVVVFVFEAWM